MSSRLNVAAQHECLQTERLQRIEEALDRITQVLDGNGRPGILTRLALLEHRAGQAGWMASEGVRWLGAILTGAVVAYLSRLL